MYYHIWRDDGVLYFFFGSLEFTVYYSRADDDALIGASNIINTVPAGTRYSYYYTVQYDTRLVTRLPGSGTGTVATVATLV